MKKLAILLVVMTIAFTGAFATDTITKALIGKEDIYWGTDNVTAETFSRATSTGSTITLTRLNGSQIPWDNSYTRTIRPLNVTGNGSGTISGYALTVINLVVSGTSTLTGALSGSSASFTAGVSSDNVATGAITSTGVTVTGNSSVSGIASVGALTLNTRTRTTGTAAPTSGTYVTGAIVWNTTPALDNVISVNPIYWYCSVAGTPGTWKAVYPIFRVAPASSSALGKPGMVAVDSTSIYWNHPSTDNTWFKAEGETW